jgi:hypothetical protein
MLLLLERGVLKNLGRKFSSTSSISAHQKGQAFEVQSAAFLKSLGCEISPHHRGGPVDEGIDFVGNWRFYCAPSVPVVVQCKVHL